MFLKIFGNLLIFISRKEIDTMAMIYVALIIKGKRDYASVPEVIKPKVRELLVDLELEELIIG